MVGQDLPPVAEIGADIAAVLGRDIELVPVEGSRRDNVGDKAFSIPSPFVLSLDKLVSSGIGAPLHYAYAVRPAIDWLATRSASAWRDVFPILAGYPFELFDYAAEDHFLAGR